MHVWTAVTVRLSNQVYNTSILQATATGLVVINDTVELKLESVINKFIFQDMDEKNLSQTFNLSREG